MKTLTYPPGDYRHELTVELSGLPGFTIVDPLGNAQSTWRAAFTADGSLTLTVPDGTDEQQVTAVIDAHLARSAAIRSERDQLRAAYAALRDGTGTAAERLRRLEIVVAWLMRREALDQT